MSPATTTLPRTTGEPASRHCVRCPDEWAVGASVSPRCCFQRARYSRVSSGAPRRAMTPTANRSPLGKSHAYDPGCSPQSSITASGSPSHPAGVSTSSSSPRSTSPSLTPTWRPIRPPAPSHPTTMRATSVSSAVRSVTVPSPRSTTSLTLTPARNSAPAEMAAASRAASNGSRCVIPRNGSARSRTATEPRCRVKVARRMCVCTVCAASAGTSRRETPSSPPPHVL